MAERKINKIIYFDKETIQNILQEQDKGKVLRKTDISNSSQRSSSIETAGSIELNTPFWARLKFLFKSKIDIKYIVSNDDKTTISSTEISEFEKLKPQLELMKGVQIYDIENSSTFFRVASGYLRIAKGGVEGLDVKEFKNVMDNYDGYDTYKIKDNQYVRFNNSAFVSNYKRNDILTTTMTIYCIPVGKFNKDRFDFLKEIEKMDKLITTTRNSNTLGDIFPSSLSTSSNSNSANNNSSNTSKVMLYDVIYACVESEA